MNKKRAIALWDLTWERRSHFGLFGKIRYIALSDNKGDRALSSLHKCRQTDLRKLK
ncbi:MULTISPECIES: hypothetical protein [unclassified Microcoleus]|uniref:hypothetical protein n=1 Tax=unclassified Microcoleus TaxID=2642155 RepID=UPI002FD0EA63